MSDTSNIIQFGDLRVARTKEEYLRKLVGCQHRSIRMDDGGDIVTCTDCDKQLSPYWTLKLFTDSWLRQTNSLEAELAATKAERETHLHLKAAKLAESAWRSRDHVPTCPHCWRGIFPEDGFGHSSVNKEFERGLRVREKLEAAEKGTYVAKLAPGKPPAAKVVKQRTKGKPAPVWADAPKWAQWLTCNRKGHWYWHAGEPASDLNGDWQSAVQRAFAGSTIATEFMKQPRPTAPQEEIPQ